MSLWRVGEFLGIYAALVLAVSLSVFDIFRGLVDPTYDVYRIEDKGGIKK